MHTLKRVAVARFSSVSAAVRKLTFFAAIFVLSATFTIPARPDSTADTKGLNPIRTYIKTGWDTLTRSMNECGTVVDTKLAATSVMYLPADFPEPAALKALQKDCKFEVKHLPAVIHHPGEVDANK
jgi:hypothetical protein